MKTLAIALTAAIAAVADVSAEAVTKPAAPNAQGMSNLVSKVKAQRKNRKQFIAENGGMVEQPGVSKGKLYFLDTQDMLAPSNVIAAVSKLDPKLKAYDITIEKVAPGDPAALKAAAKADVAVIIVCDDKTPVLLAAPDDDWAVVNVKRCLDGLKTPEAKEKFFASRCRKEILRAFAYAAGGASSSFKENIMTTTTMADLDFCREFIPMDRTMACVGHLTRSGLKPREFLLYRYACEDGWAPPPTNDVQKAVWEDVKRQKAAETSKEKKITFDPKKGE